VILRGRESEGDADPNAKNREYKTNCPMWCNAWSLNGWLLCDMAHNLLEDFISE
jgi:hypothetical protein